MKLLIYCENPSSNLLQEACSGFPIATSDQKLFLKHPVILKNVQNRLWQTNNH